MASRAPDKLKERFSKWAKVFLIGVRHLNLLDSFENPTLSELVKVRERVCGRAES